MKKSFVYLGLVASLLFSVGIVSAEVQSPIYTDDIGRSHFLGRGGYSTVRQMNMQGMEANAINDAANTYSQKAMELENKVSETASDLVNTVEKTTTDITEVIKEKQQVPVSSHSKTTFTSEKRKMDASAPFGYGMTNINSGVNESKTIYTDDLGRLHFFGRANQIRE